MRKYAATALLAMVVGGSWAVVTAGTAIAEHGLVVSATDPSPESEQWEKQQRNDDGPWWDEDVTNQNSNDQNGVRHEHACDHACGDESDGETGETGVTGDPGDPGDPGDIQESEADDSSSTSGSETAEESDPVDDTDDSDDSDDSDDCGDKCHYPPRHFGDKFHDDCRFDCGRRHGVRHIRGGPGPRAVSTGPQLPMTGAPIAAIAIAAGSLLAAGTGGVVFTARRRRRASGAE